MPVADYATYSSMIRRMGRYRSSGVFAFSRAVKDIALGAISIIERLYPRAEHFSFGVALQIGYCHATHPDGFLHLQVQEAGKRSQANVSNIFNNPIDDGSGIRS